MYTKKELLSKGFKKDIEDIVVDLLANKVDNKYIEEIKAELLKHGFAYEGNYKKFIDEMEIILLLELCAIKDSYGFEGSNLENANEITDLLNIKVIDKEVFPKEYCIVDISSWQPYHGYYNENLPLIISNNDLYYKADNSIYQLETDIENNFGIEFLNRKIEHDECEECESYSNEFVFTNSVLKDNKPLMILQVMRQYSDGEPGYSCDELRYELIIVKN